MRAASLCRTLAPPAAGNGARNGDAFAGSGADGRRGARGRGACALERCRALDSRGGGGGAARVARGGPWISAATGSLPRRFFPSHRHSRPHRRSRKRGAGRDFRFRPRARYRGLCAPGRYGAGIVPGARKEAQCAVLCHELLHVRRHDWLATVFEEMVGALLWFNPAIWWLVARTRLAREQVVDEEVVRLTSARAPYLDALLALAGKRLQPDLAPVLPCSCAGGI